MLRKSLTQPDFDLETSDDELERAFNHREPQKPREGIDCKLCGNYEYIWVVRNGERFYHTCECKTRRDNLRKIRMSGLVEQLKRCTFESFQTPEFWQKETLERIKAFVKDENRGWLLLSGQPGCGKTHLCTAAAGKFLEAGLDARYMRWTEESVLLKACVNKDDEYERRLRPFKSCKVLYIDDFWKTKKERNSPKSYGYEVSAGPTAADVKLAFDLLDFRYCNRDLVTMISTEWTVEDLIDFDAATGSRIYEMSKGQYCIEFTGREKNWRIAHK